MKQKSSPAYKFLDRHLLILICLFLMIVLRFPNLFEPNWYGDEAIYLTVGQALRYGRELYTSIVDHKTPIIYYLAMVPGQIYFRLLTIVWMAWSSIVFYQVSKSLFDKKLALWVSNLLFIVLTSLPWLEGNIPNGELFVMGFVLTAIAFLIPTNFWQSLKNRSAALTSEDKDWRLIISGAMLGLGVLTKVPALLDFAAVAFITWLLLFDSDPKKPLKQRLSLFFRHAGLLTLGLITPIILSIFYFAVQGRGYDYLQYGLLYNLHYTSNWSLDLNFFLSDFLFSLPGKTLVLAAALLLISIAGKKLDMTFKFILSWLLMAFYAALLSNRPYPHYFQQLVPPFCLLITYLLTVIYNPKKIRDVAAMAISLFTILIIAKTALLLNFTPYPALDYYQRFYQYAAGKISQSEYYQSFNPLMHDTYQAAVEIKKKDAKETFIWGTNPMLYDLSNSIPAGKFTVSFHIKDMDAYDSTMNSLRQKKPKMIVVMRNEQGEFPEFYEYLGQNYFLYRTYKHMKLYLRK